MGSEYGVSAIADSLDSLADRAEIQAESSEKRPVPLVLLRTDRAREMASAIRKYKRAADFLFASLAMRLLPHNQRRIADFRERWGIPDGTSIDAFAQMVADEAALAEPEAKEPRP